LYADGFEEERSQHGAVMRQPRRCPQDKLFTKQVKRIRRHPRIRIAPCTMRGTVIGSWVEAEATIVDATTAAHGHAILRQKYSWMKGIGDLYSRLMHRERVVIAIRLLA
jgi:PPOX class probable F420-dependent enzyme